MRIRTYAINPDQVVYLMPDPTARALICSVYFALVHPDCPSLIAHRSMCLRYADTDTAFARPLFVALGGKLK